MIADTISSGHAWGADFCFLLAIIFAGLAAVLYVMAANGTRRQALTDEGRVTVVQAHVLRWAPALGWVAVALAALGWLIL